MELMVAMAVFTIVVGAAVTLSHFQAKKGAGSTMRKMANEAIALAAMQLRRDIVRAGFGLLDDDPDAVDSAGRLSVFVDDAGKLHNASAPAGGPDVLLLNFSDHLQMDLDPKKPNSFFSMFASSPRGQGDSTTNPWVFWKLVNQTVLQLPNVSMAIDGTSTLGLVTISSTGVVGYKCKDGTLLGDNLRVADPINQNYTNKTQTFRLQWDTAYTGKVAPAIAYMLSFAQNSKITCSDPDRVKDYARGRLLRNGVPLIGGGEEEFDCPAAGGKATGRVPFIKVTDFQIPCGFYIKVGSTIYDFANYFTDPTDVSGWTPDGNKVFGQTTGGFKYTPENLRAIEITIKYIYRDKGAGIKGSLYPSDLKMDPNPANDPYSINSARTPDSQDDKTPGPWAIGGTYTFMVSPRTIVLKKQFGENPYED
jgi:hypothetical protein